MKHAAEEYLRASGAPWTIVRATAFAEFWLDLLDQTAGASGRPVIFGRGANPINFVSVSDVAALVERAVVDPSTRGATFEIGGPQNLSFNELAAGLQRASERTAPPRHVPRAMLRLLAAVLGPYPAESCTSDSCGHRDGHDRSDLCADRSPSQVPGASGDFAGRHPHAPLDDTFRVTSPVHARARHVCTCRALVVSGTALVLADPAANGASDAQQAGADQQHRGRLGNRVGSPSVVGFDTFHVPSE